MSSITASGKVIPKTSGTAEPGLEEVFGDLSSNRPDSGIVREGIVRVAVEGIVESNNSRRGLRGS